MHEGETDTPQRMRLEDDLAEARAEFANLMVRVTAREAELEELADELADELAKHQGPERPPDEEPWRTLALSPRMHAVLVEALERAREDAPDVVDLRKLANIVKGYSAELGDYAKTVSRLRARIEQLDADLDCAKQRATSAEKQRDEWTLGVCDGLGTACEIAIEMGCSQVAARIIENGLRRFPEKFPEELACRRIPLDDLGLPLEGGE